MADMFLRFFDCMETSDVRWCVRPWLQVSRMTTPVGIQDSNTELLHLPAVCIGTMKSRLKTCPDVSKVRVYYIPSTLK